MDYLVIGKMLSASSLGIYTLAFLLTDTFRSQIMAVMNKVMFPVYGQMQNDLESVKEYYLKIVCYNSVVVFPFMVSMIVLGEPIVIIFFGNKWGEAIIPLKILALAVIFGLMVNSNTSVIRGIGKPALEMKIQIFKASLIYIPCLFLGTYFYGMIGAAMAVLINKMAAVVIAQYFLKKLIKIKLKELFTALRAPILGAALSFTLGLLVYEISDSVLLVLTILFGSYLLTIHIFMKQDILLMKNKFNELKNKKTYKK